MSTALDPNTGAVIQVARVYKGTADPTSAYDFATHDVSVGDIFVRTDNGTVFVCTANTTGAATWLAV